MSAINRLQYELNIPHINSYSPSFVFRKASFIPIAAEVPFTKAGPVHAIVHGVVVNLFTFLFLELVC